MCDLRGIIFVVVDVADIVTIGITNQRETTIVWDKTTGQPLYNAIGKITMIFKDTFRFTVYLVMFALVFTLET